MSWPGRIPGGGGFRRQFAHVIDITPTILEAAGIPQPEMVNGIKQTPMEGTSMVYTWDKANANVPTRHTTQYFEMLGNRSIYHDGWVAATTPATLPWELSNKPAPDVITGYNWELYHVAEDPTQYNDLAAQMPEKLKELQAKFYSEAAKYNVLPLDNSTLARWNTPRPSLTPGRTVYTYSGSLPNVPKSAAPNLLNRAYTIKADLDIPKGGAEGVIVTEGGRFGGYVLMLSDSFDWWQQGELIMKIALGLTGTGLLVWLVGRNRKWVARTGQGMVIVGVIGAGAVLLADVFGFGRGKPVFVYNLLDLERTVWSGPALGEGKHVVKFDYTPQEPGLGKGGTGVLYVDGKEVARKSMKHSTPITFPEDETFDVGEDTRTPVALLEHRYEVPFKFTGKLDKLTIDTAPQPAAAKL